MALSASQAATGSAFLPATSPSTMLRQPTRDLDLDEVKDSTSTPSESPIPPTQDYKCPLCQETQGSQKEFTQHIRGHNEVKPSPDPNDPTGQAKVYYCCLCRKMLSSFSSLDRHMLVHSGERPFSCERCGQTFTTNGNMHRHSRTHGSRDSRESDISSGGSQTSQSKPRGPTSSTGGPGGRKRKASLDSMTNLQDIAQVANKTGHAKCPLCPETFFSDLSLETHVQSVHQGQNIQCDECPHQFPSYTYLKLHKNMYHPTPSFPFRSAFQLSALSMAAHQTATTIKEEQAVSLKKMKDEKVLDLSSPVKQQQQPLPAPPPSLQLMILPVEPPRSSNMSQFTSIEALTQASTTSSEHGNDNSDANADENDHLIRDMKLKGEFPCRLCDAVFPNLRALKGHNKEHMDRPPYVCNVGACTYNSNDKSTLARHMRTHTGEKPFECTICNFGFTTKANCERHVKNKHAKCTREEVRDAIVIHESAEDSNGHMLNTSMTESNGSDSLRENDTPSPSKKVRHESGLGGGSSNERIFAPYRSSLYRPKSTEVKPTINVNHQTPMTEKTNEEAPLDLSRPLSGDSFKENNATTTKELPLKHMPNAMDFTKSFAAMASGLHGLPGQMPLPFILSQLAGATGSFDWAAYLMAHQQQEALRRQREAEMAAAAAMASSLAGPQKDPTSLLMHLNSLQSLHHSSSLTNNVAPLATSPEKVVQSFNEDKSDCSEGDYKMIIKNGVLMRKQKQRRYRTERPHECEHCNARFTLRSNMDRHIKQQHAAAEAAKGPGSANNDYSDEEKEGNNHLVIDDDEPTEDNIEVDDEEEEEEEEEEGMDLSSLENMIKGKTNKPFNTFFDTTEDEDEEEEEDSKEGSEGSEGSDGNNLSANSAERKLSAYSAAPHKIECPFCPRTFPWSSSMKRHILTHTGHKPYKCPECPLWFTTKSNCDRHLVRKHGNNNTTTDLVVVNKELFKRRHFAADNNCNGNEGDASSNDEDEHHGRKMDTTEAPFKCYLCDDGHSAKEDALKHLKTSHPDDYQSLMSKGAFDCNNDVSTSPANNEEDTFDQLRGQFPDYANRRIICLFCMRKFWSAEDLRRHVRTHTGEKPYECDICHRKFTLKHSMLRHRKKHDSGVSSGGEDSDSEGGHSTTYTNSVELGRSSPEEVKSGETPLVKKKKPSLMDKINQLSSAATSNGTTTSPSVIP
jgi:uncharacterized Zn-finger protein